MSLCVAWKYEDGHGCRVYFAADSCAVMEAGKHVMPHGGIKIMEIPIQIFSATDEKLGKAELLFSQKYGMAFAGSYFTAFLMKELVAEVLTPFPVFRNGRVHFFYQDLRLCPSLSQTLS